MLEFDASYFDGRTSIPHPVRATASNGRLYIAGNGIAIAVSVAELKVDPRIGNLRRRVTLPGGACLQTDDHAALALLMPRANMLESWVQGLERRWQYALAGLALTALASWWFVAFGLPMLAGKVATYVPVSVETTLGEHTLDAIDSQFCQPSALPKARQQALQSAFSTLTQGLHDGYPYRLLLRSCDALGANAFAMPGGSIVVTDGLVNLAKNDLQISAVLAHEIGHVRRRHGLRIALHGAGIALLTATLFGDAASITGLAVTLPTVLLQTGYSRDFETEADSYAFARLKQVGQSPRQFAEMMQLLEAGREKHGGKKPGSGGVMDYVSTHPVTAKRIARALANS